MNNGQLKIVLTSRQNVLSEAKHKLDKLSVIKNNVIELTSGALTGDENHGILDVLLDHHKRDKSEVNIQKCCDVYKANIGFPYCSFLFAADKSLFYLREQFFARPQQFFKEALGALNKDTKVALLFLFYTQGRCSESDLKLSTKKTHSQNEETLTWISYLIGISDGEMSLARVRDILEELSGVNVTHLSKSFAFAHNIVYESVALMHGERYPEEVIEHCTWNFIIGCVTTVAKGAEAELVIGNHLYENLCLRFIDRTMSGKPLHRNFYDVRTHRAIQTRDVCTTLYKLLHKQGKLREFLTCFMHDNQQGFLYDYLHNKGEGEIPLLVEEAVPYLKCNCDPDEFCPCWKCNVRNNTASGACLTGDVHSYCLMLNEGITITSNNIRQACTGENPELLKLVISTVKGHGMFMPEDVCISKSLVEAKQSKIPEMYEILYAEGAVVMPLCVYGVITYGNVTLTAVDHFVKELKRNGKWDPTDFWLQKALEASVSLDDSDIRKLLIEEGLIYHRGCLLSAVKTKQLSKVRETVMGMKALGTWQPSDYIIEQEYIKYLIMLRRGETQPFTIPSPANKGINEALIVAMNYEDRSIYEYLLTEGVRLTMETLPPVVETGQLERVKEVIKELKDNGEWDVTERACTQAIFQAIHRNLTDTFDLLVTEGITCTMETLKSIVAKEDVTVKDVEEVASHIKRSDNWQPNSIYMQMALVEAFQKEDKSVFDYLMKNGPKLDPYSVMIAVYTQDINAVSMCLQSLKNSHNWDPSDLILNKCMEMTKETSPEIYAVLSDAGVTFSSESLLSAAAKNDTNAIMWTVNELIDSDKWSPQTDDKVTRSLEFMCQYSNKMMFNILQKKGAKLTQLGVFNIIQNSKSLWYDTGPENRKSIEGVPTLAALVVASLAKRFLIPAFQQKAITVYVRLIHALEETGILDSKDPLLHDALVAAVESGDILAYDIVTETGTEVTEEVVIKLLQGTKCSLRIEFPEMLMNRTYRTCVMQCLLESIRKKKTFMC